MPYIRNESFIVNIYYLRVSVKSPAENVYLLVVELGFQQMTADIRYGSHRREVISLVGEWISNALKHRIGMFHLVVFMDKMLSYFALNEFLMTS